MYKKSLIHLYHELQELKQELINHTNFNEYNPSLVNLKAYVHLRKKDITLLQEELTNIGLSSLGRSQSYILHAINKDLVILQALLGNDIKELEKEKFLSLQDAQKIMLEKGSIFGTNHEKLRTNIMVTLPSEAIDSPEIIRDLIAHDTDVLRINTAHDDVAGWTKMAQTIKKENELQNKNTKIYVDLAGPKNRTGTIHKEILPFKIGSHDEKKVEIIPKILSNSQTKPEGINGEYAALVVDDRFYAKAFKAKSIFIKDIQRKKKQSFKLKIENERLFAILDKKILIIPNTTLKIKIDHNIFKSKLYNFEAQADIIRLFRGDTIIITPDDIPSYATYEYDNITYSSIVHCSNKEIFKYVKLDDTIFIDDGKIGCVVTKHLPIGLECRVVIAKEKGTLLKEEKGINFPDTDLTIDAITPTDEKNFEEIVKFADIIGISFAQRKEDILKLQNMLKIANKDEVAIVPKIETKLALKNLPEILEQLLQSKNYAVMIARGDLAIEVGFDNLPYVQEEIFSICEAAHIPVIYATQIMEGKMKNNLPSRAEVIDAANAQRADCVMLNKGAFVVDTIDSLQHIITKIHQLFQKNRQLLTSCELW